MKDSCGGGPMERYDYNALAAAIRWRQPRVWRAWRWYYTHDGRALDMQARPHTRLIDW